jgi:hypothetical protein
MDLSGLVGLALDFDRELKAFSHEKAAAPPAESHTSADSASCQMHQATASIKSSLAETRQGQTALHRLFEIAAQAPAGKSTADYLGKVAGLDARLLKDSGIEGVEVKDGRLSITLSSPQQFHGERGTLTVGEPLAPNSNGAGKKSAPDETVHQISFTPVLSADGAASMQDIKGIKASSSILDVDVTQIDLRPLEGGFLTAVLKTNFVDVPVCATRDKISELKDSDG